MNKIQNVKNYSIPKKILISIFIFLLFVSVLETSAVYIEKTLPSAIIDFDGGFSSMYTLFVKDDKRPEYRITNPLKLNIFQKQSFLEKKESGTYRIIFLGESSVYNLQPLFANFIEELKRKYPKVREFEVINGGGNSYGSTRLLLAAREMAKYEPDLLLIYMGHNEFEELEQYHLINPENTLVGRIYYQSALYRLATTALLNFNKNNLEKKKQLELFSKSPDSKKAWAYQFTPQDLEGRMQIFKNNLESIVKDYQIKKVPIIIGSVPSNIYRPYLPAAYQASYEEFNSLYIKREYEKSYSFGEEFLANVLGRHQSSIIENKIIWAIAEKYKIPLADVKSKIVEREPNHIPGERLFSDHCHLTQEGNTFLIAVFMESIVINHFVQ